ncbi:MAG: DDE-type integrase/transposase/recombinase [Actinobacteria bacterium]|nr:DDE-type integrase/transposase/recombinase [Actinomycetota bacterium]
MHDRHHDIALFRYSLVRPAADPGLTTRQRGRLVRELAAGEHVTPWGERTVVSRNTLDRWVRLYRAGGFEALVPASRQAEPTTPASVLALAEALRRENPERTAAHVAAIIFEAHGWSPSERTIQRLFARLGLNRHGPVQRRAFGRFEASAPNERWTGDALHGPTIGGRKTYLFAFIDDHSRLLCGYRWGHSEDTLRLEAALRAGMEARGIPASCYLDNGSAMVSRQLLRACATLRIALVHSRPGKPEGRGKIERFFRTVRGQFLVEVAHADIAEVASLNRLFAAWVEGVYHRATHSETGEAPLQRFEKAAVRRPTPAELHDAFLWAERRQVTKTATVSLHGNIYEVDAALVGRRVELIFDPFDMTDIEVRFGGQSMGKAAAHRIGRHTHPQAKPDTPPPPTSTGIDYLRLVERRRDAELVAPIDYSRLVKSTDPDQCAGQLQIPIGDEREEQAR